jgi:hypothetical protein
MKEKIKSSGFVTGIKKKTQAAGSRGKKSGKDILINNLKQIIKDVDEEGLLFLIKQANVLVYNKRIDELNTEIKKPGTRIKIKKQPFSDKISMDIKEADDSSSFIFIINKARKFFTLEEMRKIVKICHLSSDENDASGRLYTWFKNNRGDVLNDIGIDNSDDYSLPTMYNFIKNKYTVKE